MSPSKVWEETEGLLPVLPVSFPSHFPGNYMGAYCKSSLNSYLCAKSRAASPVKWVEEYSRCLGHLMSLVYVYRHVYVLNKL